MTARWLFACVGALFAVALLRDSFDAWVRTTDLPVTLRETSQEVTASDGSLLRVFPVADGIIRLRTRTDQIDPRYLAMLVRYEDKRFYSHAGVDPLAMMRAAVQALRYGRPVSGGSTLTMQVARLLEDGSTGLWRGKIRQMRVALALERRLSKDQILSLYITHAPFGGALEGVRSAAFAWFDKDPRRLTEAEAALLIALPQSPETRRPDKKPDAALTARTRVIDRLESTGLLSGEEAAAARRARLPGAMAHIPLAAPHLADRLRGELRGAEVISTTIDPAAQHSLQALAKNAVRTTPDGTGIAILAADHRTGDVVAYVGSAAYSANREGFVDMVRAKRSPGSLLKPFVYALAFDRGLAQPETLVHDGPVTFGSYAPQNFDNHFRGDVSMRSALQQSLNIPVVKLTEAIGPTRLLATLRKGGTAPAIRGTKPGLAISLGGLGLSLEELVQLYGGLAAGGHGPALSSLKAKGVAPDRLMSRATAWQVANILSDLPPPPGSPRGVLAYKTGTSYGHRDAWAVGFDGTHVIGVWMGRPDGTPVPGAFGGNLAAPVLFDAFARLKPAFDPFPAPPPETLILSNRSLPLPLRRFGEDGARDTNRLELLFPPDGARLELADDVPVKVRGGAPPFTVLANGVPVNIKRYETELFVPSPGPGFTRLTVVDSKGRSAQADIELTQP